MRSILNGLTGIMHWSYSSLRLFHLDLRVNANTLDANKRDHSFAVWYCSELSGFGLILSSCSRWIYLVCVSLKLSGLD